MNKVPRFKIHLLAFTLCLLFSYSAHAQQMPGTPVDSATVSAVLKKCETKYPKFYRELNYLKANDKLIKNIYFVRYNGDMGPARAGPKGNIFIDIKYLETEQKDFGDDRLIVVLYHEIGHLHYFAGVTQTEWANADKSEQAAFEYSLLKTKELAEKGDCLPLKTGVYFMKLRSEGTNLADPHVRALKRMVQEPLYAGYVKYVKEKCP